MEKSKKRFVLIADSSIDLDQSLRERLDIAVAPLTIYCDDQTFVDDFNLDDEALLRALVATKQTPRTAAPAPGAYLEAMAAAEEGVFIITISAKLSGSHNAALTAQQMAKEKYPHLKVAVIDSGLSSVGETALAIKLREAIDQGGSFEKVMAAAEAYCAEHQLFVLVDNIDNLVKSGRINQIQGRLAILLKIKPILSDNGKGEIRLVEKPRSFSKGLNAIAEIFINSPLDTSNRTLVISHCAALAQAKILSRQILDKRQYKEVIIVPMGGISMTYSHIGSIACSC